MATGTNGIATRENANNIKSGAYSSDLKRCVTYSSAINSGFTVSNADRYTGNTNRLVRYSDLSYTPPAQYTVSFLLYIDITSSAILYNNGPITLNADYVGLTLKKVGSANPILLQSTYGPVKVNKNNLTSERSVTFTLYTNTVSESFFGDYTLSIDRLMSAGPCLKTNNGLYPHGNLRFNTTNGFEQTITVNKSSFFMFTSVWS